MLLKRLELSGFKSFARTTILEFTTPVTAIVGPNGSGKSNIVEAMRFVLGEQSIKSLRGKRGEDLIFHGSQTLTRLGRASVAVVFDNSKGVFNLDYDEIEIKRVVYRDGVNQYLVNGSKTRLKDILELLAAVHIGASSHHIISQGETDRILNSSIKERRAMIEDALGLKIYQYKLKDSERKLLKTKENIRETESLRREIASHLSFLEKQVEKIREAEALRAELITLYKTYLKAEETFLSLEKDRLNREKATPMEELKELEKKIKEKEAFEKKGEGEGRSGTRLLGLENEIRRMGKERDSLSRALGRIEGLLEYSENEREKQEKRGAPRVFFPRDAFQEFVKNIREMIESGESVSDSVHLKGVLNGIKEKIVSFLRDHEGAQRDGYDEAAFKKLKAEKEKTNEALEKIQEKENELARTFDGLRRRHEEERGALRLIEKELYKLRTRENELKTQLELFAYREVRMREEETRFHRELTDAGYLLGTKVLSYSDVKLTQEELPTREEQEKKKQKIERIKIKTEEVGGGSADIIKEYEEVRERDSFLARETGDLIHTAESLEKLIKELLERIDKEFKEGVEKINKEFQDIFEKLFGGGHATLEIVNTMAKKHRVIDELFLTEEAAGESEDTEEGIDISVTLPTKRVKGLEVLSGGERSLTSIALVFAITLVNPPPFLILDETDAALDEANSRKYGALLLKLKARTQFVVITHNRETMMRAGVLYGVTSSADGTSRILSVKLSEAEEMAE